MPVFEPCNHFAIGVRFYKFGGVVVLPETIAMSRCANPQPLPFGVRRPPDRVQVRLSKLELLFVGLAMSALIYLGSLGPRIDDAWIKAAQAEFHTNPGSAQPQRHHLTVAQDN